MHLLLQRKGTAMGTIFTPIYAALILGYLEETPYKNEDVFDLDFKTYIEENFKRFFDDCFILFTKSDEDLTKLHEFKNTFSSHLSPLTLEVVGAPQISAVKVQLSQA